MTVIKNTTTGRFNTDVSEVMSHVRKPVFVDNAVHHARVSVQTSSKPKITVEKSNTRTLQVMPQSSYQIVEGESGVQITHAQTPGHEYTGKPYFNGESLSSSNVPILLFNELRPSERLVLKSIEDSTIGVFGHLQNMKSRTLDDIGFTHDAVKMGQPLDIGLRTTDLAIKLAESVDTGITSMNIGRHESVVTKKRNHSTRFIGQNFNNTNLLTALRYIARHDGRMVLLDTFGNLLYVPISFSENTIDISNSYSSGQSKNPIDNSANRVTLQGIPMALNDLVIVTVDDAESQTDDVREISSPFVDHTVRNKNSAKRVARKILRGQSLMKGAETISNSYSGLGLRPGMTVIHEGKNKIITEIRHQPFAMKSDISLMNIDVGLEGILQSLHEGFTVEANNINPENIFQITDVNLAMFGKVELKIHAEIYENKVMSTAILIGGTSRGTVGGRGEPMGGSKSSKFLVGRGGV